MKNKILILFLFFTLTSFSGGNKKGFVNEQSKSAETNLDIQNNEITIKYSTPIKGYNVSAKWLIRGKLDVPGSENFSGPAILTFENIDTKEISWVLHPEFTIDIDEENLKYFTVEDGQYIKNQSFTQISKYITPKFEKVGTSEEEKEEGLEYTYIPFFFQDVDFDDKDELILTYAKTYEKGGSQNKIFKTPDYHSLEFSEMTNEPFANFSGFYYGNPSADAYGYTTIDYENKTIKHSGASGAGGIGKVIYEFKKSEGGDDYHLFKKTDINNYNDWEIEDTTIYTYDDYGMQIIAVKKVSQKL